MTKSVWNINLDDESPFYDQFRYPGGEYQIRFKHEYQDENPALVRIVCRNVHGDGLIKLAQLRDAIHGLNPACEVDLILPYLPYGRADRRFVTGDCRGLMVFAGLINSMNFCNVWTLDAHSSKAQDYINDLVDVSAIPLIYRAIARFATTHNLNTVNVLFPDKGAKERYVLGRLAACNTHILTVNTWFCEKQRDPATGKLLGFDVPTIPADHALIVDDICDGGGTFLGIADKIPEVKLGLYVTHGIFSKGFDDLKKYFSNIYTTDSFGPVSTLDAAVFNSVTAILTK